METQIPSTDGILALKWKDIKPVLFMSNFHNPDISETTSRGITDIQRCAMPDTGKWLKNMGFGDKFDMLKSP